MRQKAPGERFMTPPLQPSEESKAANYFIGLCIHGADEIRRELHMDESLYSLVDPSAHSRARDYYLYGVLDELERAGAALLRFKDLLSDEEPKIKPTEIRERRINRNLLAAIGAEQSLWIRKLTELLVELISFNTTNTHDYFRHYLLCKGLGDYLKLQADFSDYYGCANRNMQESITAFKSLISGVETKIHRQKCWYLQPSKKGTSYKPSDFKTRFNYAIPRASAIERVALGLSYETAFSHVSRGIHVNIGSPDNEVSWVCVHTAKSQIEILAMQVLLRCRRLLSIRRHTGIIAQIAKIAASNTYPTAVYGEMARGQVSKGDFVIAYGDLGEVLKSVKTKFGYKSYLIRYLSKPPIAAIDTDWFPARYVRRMYKASDLRRQIRAQFSAQGASLSPKIVARSLRKTVLEFWNEGGLKEWARGDAAASEEKGRAFAARKAGGSPLPEGD
jgi:hypothetical protein